MHGMSRRDLLSNDRGYRTVYVFALRGRFVLRNQRKFLFGLFGGNFSSKYRSEQLRALLVGKLLRRNRIDCIN